MWLVIGSKQVQSLKMTLRCQNSTMKVTPSASQRGRSLKMRYGTFFVQNYLCLLMFTYLDEYRPDLMKQGSNLVCFVWIGNNMLAKISTPNRAKKFSKDAMLGFGAEKQDNSYSWSSMSKEAKALINLNEQASSHSKPNKSSRGIVCLRKLICLWFSFLFFVCCKMQKT